MLANLMYFLSIANKIKKRKIYTQLAIVGEMGIHCVTFRFLFSLRYYYRISWCRTMLSNDERRLSVNFQMLILFLLSDFFIFVFACNQVFPSRLSLLCLHFESFKLEIFFFFMTLVWSAATSFFPPSIVCLELS